MIICKFCNTENKSSQKRCISCGGLLEDRKITLTKKDKDLLKKFAEISEKSITAEINNNDIKFSLTVYGAFLIEAFIIYATYSVFEYKIWSILISLFSATVIIVAGSYLITGYDKKAAKNIFENDVKYRILEYLKEMQFDKDDFTNIINENKMEFPYLKQFADKIS